MSASVFIATSLDGFIARPDGALDWLPTDPEPHGYDEFMAGIDAIVIGRKTYETVLAFDAWPYGKKEVVVLSARPSELTPPPDGAVCQTMTGTPQEVMAWLATRGLEHAYIDGGITVTRFLEAGLIQRLIITRIPVLLGSGIPLFGPLARDIRLEHIGTRSYPSGLVQSEYAIAV
jgi:dihydrofolate reductase